MNLLKKLTKQNDEAEIRDNIPVPVNEILQVETTPHKSHKKTDKELEMLQEAFSHPTDLPKDVAKKSLENLLK